ncbi:DMT family transporter [Candidatus Dojkabacteria bacterium]|nr:DMT family transporter [Candidatus Dojkabacteria bacterium]
MSDNLLAFVLSLVAMFMFGYGNAVTKKYAMNLGAVRLLVYRGFLNVVFLSIILLFFLNQTTLDKTNLLKGGALIAVSYLGLMFFNKSVEAGKVGIVVPVSAARILVSAFVAVSLLDDTLNLFQIFAIVIIFSGVALLSLDFGQLKNSDIFKLSSGIPYALLAAVFWGATLPFFGYFGERLGVVFFTFFTELIVWTEGMIQTKSSGKALKLDKEEFKVNGWGILMISISSVIGGLAVTQAYTIGNAGIVGAISGASPLVAVIAAWMFFAEKLSLKQYFAIALVIGGIISLSVF